MKPKILFALESFFPEYRAGTEIYVLNICNYLISCNWEVAVIISTTTNRADYKYNNIPVFTFKIPKKPKSSELNGLIAPRGINKFEEKVRSYKPDIVHFHTFGRAINYFHLQLVHELGIKTAFTTHLGSLFCAKGDLLLNGKNNCDGNINQSRCTSCLINEKGLPKQVNNILTNLIVSSSQISMLKFVLPSSFFHIIYKINQIKKINELADKIYAIAPWIQAAYKINGINSSQLIPQGISPLFFETEKKHKNIENQINFAFIGRMHRSKGFDLLIKAWDCIAEKSSNLHVLTNPSDDDIDFYEFNKRWAQKRNNVYWNVGLSQKEVADYLSKIDVLILPSISNEVAPLVILEAATRNIPVICSNYIAFQDLIIDGVNGLIFENRKWEHLRDKLRLILDDPLMITQLSNNVKYTISMNDVSLIIENDYKEIISL